MPRSVPVLSGFLRSFTTVWRSPKKGVPWLPLPLARSKLTAIPFLRPGFLTPAMNSRPFTDGNIAIKCANGQRLSRTILYEPVELVVCLCLGIPFSRGV